jgi:hypothetical protein
MPIDFTDLKKCCPKHDFPLARIDRIIDSSVGCEMMALLDCFSGYNQIWLRREDEEKTTFITLFFNVLVPQNARRSLQHRANFLWNDEGSSKGPSL